MKKKNRLELKKLQQTSQQVLQRHRGGETLNRGQQTPPLVNKLGHTVSPRPLRQGSRLSKESRQRSKHTHPPRTEVGDVGVGSLKPEHCRKT